MKRTFDLDVLIRECGARLDVIACITDRDTAGKIL
jgi:hypothetical protein